MKNYQCSLLDVFDIRELQNLKTQLESKEKNNFVKKFQALSHELRVK